MEVVKPKGKMNGKKRNKLIFVAVMLAVPIVHWLIFWLYVNLNSILMAFQLPTGEWSMDSLRVVLREIGAGDSTLRVAIKNTLLYFTKDLLMLPFQLLIAYFLYRKICFYRGFQILFYLPAIVSGVAISNMFSNFIAPSGPLGELLKSWGVNPVPEFLADSDYATPTILFFTIWTGWGGQMLLLGGALARIPVEVLESARLDGISTPREIVSMVVPLVWSTMSTILILNMTGLFAASGPILLFTKGLYETSTIGYWIFDKVAFVGVSAYNEVAAAGLVFTAIGVPVIMFFKWLIEKVPTVDY